MLLRVLLIVGLPYIAGILTVALIPLLRRHYLRPRSSPSPAPQNAAASISAPLKRDPAPLRTWATYASRVRSDRDMVDGPGHGVSGSRAGGSYIPPEWTPHVKPPLA